MNKDFKVGDSVTWTSAANGTWKTKTGTISKVFNSPRLAVVSYEVEVPPPAGSKAKPKVYRPRTSALKRTTCPA